MARQIESGRARPYGGNWPGPPWNRGEAREQSERPDAARCAVTMNFHRPAAADVAKRRRVGSGALEGDRTRSA